MKPTFKINRLSRPDGASSPSARQVPIRPITDWSYQASALGIRTAGGKSVREKGFHSLIQRFALEENRESRFEAALLAVIVALAAWPVADAVRVALGTV